MISDSKGSDREKRAIIIGGVLLAVMACSLRLPQLGQLGLWGDEGYTAIAVQGILAEGVPRLPSGGIYPRALPFSYLEALSARLFGLNEFALRLPNVFINMAGIWMAFVLSRRVYGLRVAAVVAFLMTFSTWEIIFSRYARMYIPLQCLFLVGSYSFYRGFIEGEKRFQWLTAPVWLFTIAVHDLGIFLSPLLMIPFFIKDYRQVKRGVLIAGLMIFGLLWKAYESFQSAVRWSETAIKLGGEVVKQKLPFALPPTELFKKALGEHELLALVVTAGGLGLAATILLWRIKDRPLRLRSLYCLGIVGACLFNQIGLALLLLAFYAFIFFENLRAWRQRPFLMSCTFTLFFFFFWTGYGLAQGLGLKHTISILFHYPYFYDRFLKFFVPGFLVISVLAGLGILLSGLHFIGDRNNTPLLFGLAALIGPLVLLGLIERGDNALRYSLHLFPFILMLAAYAVVYAFDRLFPQKIRPAALSAFIVVMLVVPGDFQLSYTLALAGNTHETAIRRTLQTPGSGRGYPFHPDYKSPSHFMRDRLSEDDLVISMLEAIPFYYIGRMDYLWIPKEDENRETEQIGYTGKVPSISTVELQRVLQENTGKTIWLFNDPIPLSKIKDNKKVLRIIDNISQCIVFTGLDRKTTVAYFYPDATGQAVCVEPKPSNMDATLIHR